MWTLLGMKQALGLVYCRASAAAVSLSEQIVAHTSDGVVVALLVLMNVRVRRIYHRKSLISRPNTILSRKPVVRATPRV